MYGFYNNLIKTQFKFGTTQLPYYNVKRFGINKIYDEIKWEMNPFLRIKCMMKKKKVLVEANFPRSHNIRDATPNDN